MGFLADASDHDGDLGDAIDGDAWGLLVAAASAFLVGGGRCTIAEWAGLHPWERIALVDAGEDLRAELAAMTGLASQGPMEAATVLAPADNGQALRAARLRDLHDRAKAAAP